MATKQLLAITLVVVQAMFTYASWSSIAGYNPGSKVTDHNAIDLDQAAIEHVLGSDVINYTLVQNIYQNGGNSKAYAEFSVPGLTPTGLSKGDAVVGSVSGIGKIYENYNAGETTIKVAYSTSDLQSSYVSCKVGALVAAPASITPGATQPYQFLDGCFSGDLNITSSGATTRTITPIGVPTNKAGRTLAGFSTKAGGLMYTKGDNGGCKGASDRSTDGCPYHDFSMYYDYYGSFDYADKFVMAAINGGPTNFGKSAGEMDFTNQDDSLRKECIKKGTAYMNAYMYAIREFEDAIDDCKAGCSGGVFGSGSSCNSLSTASVHAWDEGVAFYTGSLEGTAAGGNSAGKLAYRLAEKRCANFKTCGANHDSITGTSYVNTELFRLLAIGAHKLLLGRCDETRPILRKMVALMAIPLIQGTLRYAYKIDKLSQANPKEKGEGAVFAAAIVPRVASCNAADAETIMTNMKVGATSTSFAAVKAAFENNYACMEITCGQVGGLWYPAENRYYADAEPCDTSSNMQTWETIAGYAPGSKVTDHNAIDLDQAAIEYALSQGTIDYNLVKAIYQSGGNSKSYAEFTVPALSTGLNKGLTVVGATSLVRGTISSNAQASDTIVKVAYATSAKQSMYVSCKEGALQAAPSGTTAAATEAFKLTAGCFQAGEDLTLSDSGGGISVPTTGVVNKAGRTLAGFSTKAGGLMYTKGDNGGCKGASDRSTDGCPYHDFSMYYDYYGSFDYADKFVMAAINGGPTNFGKSAGEMDFTNQDDSLRKECIKKGTAYMNAYMYAIREFEDAIDDCKAGCSGGVFGSGSSCNSLSTASVHAWDEGVAFYTGSLEGTAAGGNSAGKLAYRLAEKRCANFKTCGANHDSVTGTSFVNIELFKQLSIGANYLLLGKCDSVRPVLRKMVALMAIPLIQGTLRYAYKIDKLSEAGPKEKGEGAVFAAAIVPRVASCNAADAETIMTNMKIGATSTSFAAVKAAFENNYACMEITCAQVGGIWFSEENKYYDGAEPCTTQTIASVEMSSQDNEKLPMWAIVVIAAVGALALCLMVLSIVCMGRANKYQQLAQGKGGETGQPIGAV